MRKYACSICGYIYDEATGDPDRGIEPGTKWDEIPDDWDCPLCGATKSDFLEEIIKEQPVKDDTDYSVAGEESLRELSFGELSALFTNLSKGCTKQYRVEEAGLFDELAEFYKEKSGTEVQGEIGDIIALISEDLSTGYSQANSVAGASEDRGALRALVWGEKVTKILRSILNRYEKNRDALLEDTHIYVCDICGFVYIGDELPDICPVCKVPNKKIIEIKRG